MFKRLHDQNKTRYSCHTGYHVHDKPMHMHTLSIIFIMSRSTLHTIVMHKIASLSTEQPT